MDFTALQKVTRRLALEAGDAIMEIYNGPDFEVKTKSDASPVTAADEAADAIISAGLQAAFPDVALITEEQAESHALKGTEFLIVDPLDGTKEFVHRRGDFTVNIAYVVNGVPIRGIVYAPAKQRVFYTDAQGQSLEETGPFEMEKIGVCQNISVAVPNPDGLRVVASKSHRGQTTDAYIAGRTMEWDTAAGHAILNGAGGAVVRFDDLEPLTYGKPGYENPHFIAHAKGIILQKP